MSSNLASNIQTEKTKHDVKSVARDIGQHIENGAAHVKNAGHKAGVATGVSEPTMGEKIGHSISNAIDTVTGNKHHTGVATSTSTTRNL